MFKNVFVQCASVKPHRTTSVAAASIYIKELVWTYLIIPVFLKIRWQLNQSVRKKKIDPSFLSKIPVLIPRASNNADLSNWVVGHICSQGVLLQQCVMPWVCPLGNTCISEKSQKCLSVALQLKYCQHYFSPPRSHVKWTKQMRRAGRP